MRSGSSVIKTKKKSREEINHGEMKEARRYAKAINHKWAHSFFQAGYVTIAVGRTEHIDSKEQYKLIKHLSYKVYKRYYCRYDSEELHDYFIRLSTFTKYMQDHPDEAYYRDHPDLSTARNALASMVYYATFPYNTFDQGTINTQAYLNDQKVQQRQYLLYSRLGGKKRWNRIRKAQGILLVNNTIYPKLLSSKRLEAWFAKAEKEKKETKKEDEKEVLYVQC